MTIKALVDFTNIYTSLDETMQAEMWQAVGARIFGKVKRLMNKGKNVNGKIYADYSPKYLEYKKEEKKWTGRVNLQFSGNMQKAISFSGDKKGFTIFINGAEQNEKAIKLNKTKNWQFFEWGTELDKQLDIILTKELKRMGF